MLGKRQKEILHLMANGWELGKDMGPSGHYQIQKGGLGKGGQTKHDISSDTCFALYKKGYISSRYEKFPREAFELTQLSREVLAKAKGK